MKRVSSVIAPILIISLLLAGCASSSANNSSTSTLAATCDFKGSSTPNQLPDLKLPCLTSSGYSTHQISLTSLKGPLVINLWGSWCSPCKEEMPLFRKLYLATAKSSALSIVGIDVEESSAKAGTNFMASQGMVWSQLADNNQQTRVDFGMGVPVTWFVSANGEVAFKKIGQIHSWSELRGLITGHLGINVPL